MASEDITFCANKGCTVVRCERNPKHIHLLIPHSFALFPECPNWSPRNAKWLTDQLKEEQQE